MANAASFLIVERADKIATVSLNRPEKLNAVNNAMARELAAAIGELGADPRVSVIVLRGVGHDAFSTGRDLRETTQPESESDAGDLADYLLACLHAIRDCPQPVIAMVFGFVIGGGATLALGCDIRLFAESAMFAFNSTKLGHVLAPRAIARLVARVGADQAARILCSAAYFPGRTCLEMGVATAVYPDERLEEETRALARQISRNSPSAVAAAKRTIRACVEDPTFASHPEILQLAAKLRTSEDTREGLRAFFEKRQPVFPGG